MSPIGCIIGALIILAYALFWRWTWKQAQDPRCGVGPPFGTYDPERNESDGEQD